MKWISLFLSALILFGGLAWATSTAYYKTVLTGGGASALDGIDGDLLIDKDLGFVFDGTNGYLFQLNATSGASESPPDIIAPDLNPGTKRWINQKAYPSKLPNNYITGLVPSNNGSDEDHDIDITAGEARDSTNAVDMALAASITKQIDAAWAVGANQGGLDAGSVANNTIYHIWLIKRSDTGVVDALFSTSGSAPTMPTNYDYKRWLAFVRTDGSANIKPIYVLGSHARLEITYKDYDSVATGLNQTSFTAQSLTSNLPSNGKVVSFDPLSISSGVQTVLSIDGVHKLHYFSDSNLTDGDNNEYWSALYPVSIPTPLVNNQIYYKVNTGSIELGIKRVVIER
jgi:hypothetical protein